MNVEDDVREPHKRQRLMERIKSWLRKYGKYLLKGAIVLLRLLVLLARLLDFFG